MHLQPAICMHSDTLSPFPLSHLPLYPFPTLLPHRNQILLAMQRLVHVLGLECLACLPLVLPALTYSINVHNPESLSLIEDGLGLLLVLLRNAPSLAGAQPGVGAAIGQLLQVGSRGGGEGGGKQGACWELQGV